MRAAIYARVSTGRQERDQTIEGQLTALRQWVLTQGHSLQPEHIFTDEGYSGSRLDRPGLDRLRDAAREGAFDIVAVYSPDRLARRYAYQVLLLEELRKAACEVAFVHHPISDDPHDQLLLQIQGAVAEYERALLGERFRRGKLQKARSGQWVGGKAPYGYRHILKRDGVPAHLVVNEVEAEVVRTLYGWLIDEQMTLRQILKRLAASSWRPRCGRRLWSSAVVARILSDPLYMGTAYTNRYAFVPPRRPRVRGPRTYENTCRRPRPREEWIGIPIPAIIDEATHQRALEQLRRNSALSFRNNTRNAYLLRCLLTCRTCGLAMFGITHHATDHRPERRYYQCHGKDCVVRDRDCRCPRRAVKADELEAAVWAHIQQLLNDPATLLAQFEAFARQADEEVSAAQAVEQKWQARLCQLDREEQRLLDAYQAEAIEIAELKERREQIAGRRRVLAQQRDQQARLRVEQHTAREVWADLQSFCERTRARLEEATFTDKQRILQLLIERVIVGEDTLEIRHVIPLRRPGPELPTPPPADSTDDGSAPPADQPEEVSERLRSDGVDHAPLPCRLGETLAHRLHQPQTLVADHQPHATQAARLEMPQERPPALRVFLASLAHAENLAVPLAVDPDGHQHRHVPDLPAPGTLQPDAVQVHVRVLALERPVAPRLDLAVDLLVQLTDGAGADLRAPEGLGDVLHAAHAHAGQVHLDQRLLDT